MQKNLLSNKADRNRRLLLALGIMISLMAVLFASHFAIQDRKEKIFMDASDTCKSELALLSGRLMEWKSTTQAVIDGIAQENLFRVFLSDYASSPSRVERFQSLKKDINSQEYEFFSYLQDVLNDVARMHGIRNAALLLPDGRPMLGENPGIDKSALAGIGNLHVTGFREENDEVYARTVTASFPIDQEDKPAAFLVLDIPLGSTYAKVLSSEIHHEMSFDLVSKHGTISLLGGKVILKAEEALKDRKEHILQEENGDAFAMYTAISDPAEGYMRASIPSEMLAGREARAKWNIMLMAVMTAAVIILLGAALFFADTALRERKLNNRISQQSFLLNSINSSVENGIILLEQNGTIVYKNNYFPGDDEWTRMPLNAILPEQAAATVVDKTRDVIKSGKTATIETSIEENGEKRLYRVSLFPYSPERSSKAKALAVAQFTDITLFRKRAIEQKQRVNNLLDVFACAMESVDKGFRGHTHKMLSVIALIRDELGLSADEVQTLDIAARLQGISKLFIPHELLVKQGRLTEEERSRISQAQNMASHMIQNFDFRLPVSATLAQSSERMDGTGRPGGLKGDAIIKTARVLAVVNSFCAMTSPRSYRAALPASEALQQLSADQGYDQSVVDSLAHAGHDALEKLSGSEQPQ
ncbi:MAG: hypothetical protein J6I40_07055 [Mailhella sp.]|nr:hypothetical protein [Mailhella sp.]